MPPSVDRDQRGRPRVERTAALEGWKLIQETMLSHDKDMISELNANINGLLVFAGLFSSVLTTFLGMSTMSLEPDNSELSVKLLSLIALQNCAPSQTHPFLNATADSLPTSPTFQAPKKMVIINALWFTSLVLSLSAALVGVLAKQWCHEYLRWHDSSQSALENVLLRQIRFEAWGSWKVSSVVASIPVILETALILFLAGLSIFVPTFAQDILTSVTSVFTAIALVAVTTVTLLPTFYRSCSFQSPAGWACVRIASLFGKASVVLARCAVDPLAAICNYLGSAPKWIQRISNYVSQKWASLSGENEGNWRAYNLYAITDPANTEIGAQDSAVNASPDVLPTTTPTDTVQTSVLARALAWVRRVSSDDRVSATILACARSIHVGGTTTSSNDASDGVEAFERTPTPSIARHPPRPYFPPPSPVLVVHSESPLFTQGPFGRRTRLESRSSVDLNSFAGRRESDVHSHPSHGTPSLRPSPPSMQSHGEGTDVLVASSSSASSFYHSAEFDISVQAQGQGSAFEVDTTGTSEIDAAAAFEVDATENLGVDGAEMDIEAGLAIPPPPNDTLEDEYYSDS